MLTLEEAKTLAIDHVRGGRSRDELAVIDDATVATRYGWILYVNSRAYVASRDPFEMLVGLGPIIVRHTGNVEVLPSGVPPEESIAAYERKHWLATALGR